MGVNNFDNREGRRSFGELGGCVMKKITMIKMEGCPYCAAAFRAIDEIKKNYPPTEIEVIDKNLRSELVEKYTDYYYVPSMYVDGEKIYEAHPGESYDECFANVKRVFEAAYE